MKLLMLVVLLVTLAGCAAKPNTPQQRAYDMAYMECEALAAQITGPRGNILTQSYYIANCMKAKGY